MDALASIGPWSIFVLLVVAFGASAGVFAAMVALWLATIRSSRAKNVVLAEIQARHVAGPPGKRPSRETARAATSHELQTSFSADPLDPVRPDAFDACLAFVLAAEGGFCDNPADPGGVTNLGITRKTLEAWRKKPATVDDVRSLSEVEAGDIYRLLYWDALQCGALPRGIDLMVFDLGVNAGPRRSTIVLQEALGVPADGVVGPVTLGAAAAANRQDLIAALAERRLRFCQGLKTWPTFGRGWTNRVEAVRTAALAAAA